MYSVDQRDRVLELRDVPQSSVGAPLPCVLATEGRVLLTYLVEAVDPAWDGTTTRIVYSDTEVDAVALIEFLGAYAHMFGPPNDEAFAGHPLSARGLHPYGVFEIQDSSWIRALERMNAVHPHHRPGQFGSLKHFVFAFHDSTFECVAEEFRIASHSGSMISAIREMSGRITQRLANER